MSEIFAIVPPIAPIAATDSCVAACMPEICVLMSLVAFAVCDASAFTSCATTAKPRPDSPARAASMVALSASRLVCSAIVEIRFTTSPIRTAAFESSLMRASVVWACATASPAMRLDSSTCRLISAIEALISSVAAAAERTFSEESSDTDPTTPDRRSVISAVFVSVAADSCSSDAEDDMAWTIRPTLDSNSSASFVISALRPATMRCSASARSLRSRFDSIMFCLKNRTASAISAISSEPLVATSVSMLPAAIDFIPACNTVRRRTTPRPT
jgi:hypothetical protein